MKRFFLKMLLLCCAGVQWGYAQKIQWVSTQEDAPFIVQKSKINESATGSHDVEIIKSKPLQAIRGFGGCFNELGWQSLSWLSAADRQTVMKELFAPGVGSCFNICRMPVGANDFSLQWYSYNETDSDFDMRNFSIANDQRTLIPFIKEARLYNPRLQLWASPWSPPQWMKYNHHYAQAMYKPGSKFQNGIREDQTAPPGRDMFIQQDKYFKAYALYFEKFIKEYQKQGIPVNMVMPQNEFMSPQVFPSCTWTAAGLERFLTFLIPSMQRQQVNVFFGTMNSANERIADTILNSSIGKQIKGIGLQWSGKGAIAGLHQRYPGLEIYQTEQECGNGKNDWAYCCYTWDLLKHYLNNGANAYMYWNISLPQDGMSHWGWRQNSLVSVDSATKSYHFNHEYYLLKHVSHFVKPGAKLLTVTGAFNDILAFQNPDKHIILVLRNDRKQGRQIGVKIENKIYTLLAKPDSFNTVVIEKK